MAEYGMSGFPNREEAEANYRECCAKAPELSGYPVEITRYGRNGRSPNWYWYIETERGDKWRG